MKIRLSIAAALACISMQGCARASLRPLDSSQLQSRILDPARTKSEKRVDAARLWSLPPTEDPKLWVKAVNSLENPEYLREFAFISFWTRYVRTPVQLRTLGTRFCISEWFAEENVYDATESSVLHLFDWTQAVKSFPPTHFFSRITRRIVSSETSLGSLFLVD